MKRTLIYTLMACTLVMSTVTITPKAHAAQNAYLTVDGTSGDSGSTSTSTSWWDRLVNWFRS